MRPAIESWVLDPCICSTPSRESYHIKKITSVPTTLINKTAKKNYPGNTKIVLGNPINSLIWLLNEIKKNNMILSSDLDRKSVV